MNITTFFSHQGYTIPQNVNTLKELFEYLKNNGKHGRQILEDFRNRKVESFAVQIQRVYRGHKCRKEQRNEQTNLIKKKKAILDMVLKHSNVPFKDDKNWQNNIFRL